MITSIDTTQLVEIFKSAEKAVNAKKELLNNLNVYPVPDGDTGTNMSLTLKEIVKNLDSKKDYSLKELSEIIAESSLMGGRGNSGVILSQFLGGFCDTIKDKKIIDKETLLQSFRNGTKEAYASVSEPVEGTILTVMKSATEEFDTKKEYADLTRILKSVINRSQITLKQTPDMLPKLKEAGVVDAGGAGFIYFLEGFYRALTENNIEGITGTDDYSSPPLARIWEETSGVFGMGGLRSILDFNLKAIKFTFGNTWWLFKKAWGVMKMGWNLIAFKKAFRLVKNLYEQLKWQNIKETNFSILKLLNAWQKTPEEKYCAEAILSNVKVPIKDIKAMISKVGSSVIVAQKGSITKIHFHAKNKNEAEEAIHSLGKVKTVKFDDLHKQHKEFIGKKLETKGEEKDTKVLAIINGDGFSRIYTSFEGITSLNGGKTMNPSVADLEKKLAAMNSSNIIILPNNKNVFLAAKNAADKSEKNVTVLPTIDQAQGLSALLNFNPLSTITQNTDMISNSLKLIKTFSVTKSTRKTSISGQNIDKGEIIAISENRLLSRGKDLNKIIINAIEKIKNSSQLISLYFGEDVSKEEAFQLRRNLWEKLHIEVQVHDGGQPHYYYIVTLE
ncbi:DAK2 domain-containing protein [Candidatus Dojkabacteria bacterium]|nr:DAK2 domain-containing protein [Candidatus Dojkabacteria bacterium]